MNSKIEVAPEEIFYLGKLCSALYIDYAYIAALPDIGSDLSAFEKKTQDQLVKKGFMSEDFSGEVELDEQVKEVLDPVYFGDVETELCISKKGEVNTVRCTKYHFYEDSITKVNSSVETLQVSRIGLEDIQKDVSESLEASLFADSVEPLENPDMEKSEGIVSAKATKISEKSVVKVFIILDGKLYQEDESGLKSVTKAAYEEEVGKILKGEI